MDYSTIFRRYNTTENLPFLLLNKRVEFPTDRTLHIYGTRLVDGNTPWTTMSYKIYGTIDYWWILCSLNPGSVFYANDSDVIYYIKPEYLDVILNSISSNI
jgi:hypothetical protein